MSDLQARIAAVMGDLLADDLKSGHTSLVDVADAVIRVLGLRQEHQQGPYNFLYRYGTDWMTDD